MTRVGFQERNCSDSQAHLFCTTPCSLHRSCFALTLKESPWNIPQWVPVKFPVLTKEILLSLCTPLLGSQQAALLCPLVSSLHTARLQFFPFSTLVGLCGFIRSSLSKLLCLLYLGMISRQSQRSFHIGYPFVTIPAEPGKAAIPAAIAFTIFLLIDHLVGEGWGKLSHRWSLHFYSNSFSSRESSQLNRLVLTLIFNIDWNYHPGNCEIPLTIHCRG